MRKLHILGTAAALAIMPPAAALAQGGTSGAGGNGVDLSLADTERNQQRDEGGFPWGLLGLLGLAGLLPRKRNDPGRRHTDR